ncbi:TetR/AcrR family transcriptional regulator [Dactylosporangium sucinum]|uniref:Transcriptional regulator, TetR n=1 Tax=Dactylosporangium sucinum TaxID=1424081 RepID=A0A917U987_9ACTN|nr:TetR/AcrR family transcriptional regulator [Dactylosporangium sucinum]GGM67826.1 putative transcriptional regulator, TetR [Dactylosporangium sucinum]
MPNRRDDLLDATIDVIGGSGIRALTHRAVDAAAGLPAGSTSNLFRTREALINAVVERFAERERANWEEIALTALPTTPSELADVMIRATHTATGPQRTLTLCRYAILVESAIQPALREQLLATGARVNAWFRTWLRAAGSADPDRDGPLLANHWTGLILHELAIPAPAFDPGPQIRAMVEAVIRPAQEVAS